MDVDRFVSDAVRARRTTMLVLWGAITGTAAGMGLLPRFLAHDGALESPVMVPMLGAIALATLVLSELFPRKLFADAVRRGTWAAAEVADPNAPSAFAAHTRVFAHPAEALERSLVLAYSPFIVQIALRESIALYGVVLGLMGADPSVVAAFAGVSVVSLLFAFPRLEAIAARLEQASGLAFPSRP